MNHTQIDICDTLTPEQHNMLLEFISLTGMEDINQAALMLKKHNFDINALTQVLFAQDNQYNTLSTDINSTEFQKKNYSEASKIGNNDQNENMHYDQVNMQSNFALKTELSQNSGVNLGSSEPQANIPILTKPKREQALSTNSKRNNKIAPDQDLHALYRAHVEKKNLEESQKSSVAGLLKKGLDNALGGIKYAWNNAVPTSIRGETPGGEQFMTFMVKGYPDLFQNSRFLKGSFEENIIKAHREKKPLLVYIHVDDADSKDFTYTLFKEKHIRELIEKNFLLLGLLAKSPGTDLLQKYVDLDKGSQLAVFRINLLDDIKLISTIEFKQENRTPSGILEKLHNDYKTFIFLLAEEEKIKKDVNLRLKREREQKIRQQHRQNAAEYHYYHYGPRQTNTEIQSRNQDFPVATTTTTVDPETQKRLEESRILRKIQEEEYKEVERKIKYQKEKEKEDQLQKLKEDEEKRQRKLTEEIEKQKKKDSLPQELDENDSCAINIIYRLPDGQRVSRRFNKYFKVSVLYDYIDTLDIKFENGNAEYDLIQPLPFVSIQDKTKLINDYFNDSTDEIIQVRERI